MRSFLFPFFLFLFAFGIGVIVHADSFINDSNIINIPNEEIEEIVIEADVGGSVDSSIQSDIILGAGNSDEESGDDTIVDVDVVIDGSGGSTDGISEDGSGGGGENSETITAESILNTLTGSQALTSSSDSGGGGSSNGTSLSGSKTREALLSRGITAITIPPVPEAGSFEAVARAPYTRNDLSIIVSAEMVKNPDIVDVFFTTNALTVTYKARGRLLFALPITYSTTIALKFDEEKIKKRVSIKFPWYKFLMYTGVSKKSLRNTIDSIITSTPKGGEYDRATHIFTAVSQIITSSRGVIQNSLRTVQ